MGDWDTICRDFRWAVPEQFNIADAVCDRHAGVRDKIALYYEDDEGKQEKFTFTMIKKEANRLANVLLGLGVKRGDRVGIILPQRPETAISHLAIYKIGAVAVPLANLFGPEGLKYRLGDSSAKTVVTDIENLLKLNVVRDDLPALEHVLLVDGSPEKDEIDFTKAVREASSICPTLNTGADEPAVIIYTSGTTGPPRGALHAHRYLMGHLPGFELSHDFFPQKVDLGWTPADWAWIGGLMDLLMPCWFYGVPVLAFRGKKFDPEKSLYLMEKYSVRNVFMPPTALKMIRQVPTISDRFNVKLRTIMCGGEALGAETLRWAKQELGVGINEIYGQTEANYMVGNCQELKEATPGCMGRPYPGHTVDIMDKSGQLLEPGETGEIVFNKYHDPYRSRDRITGRVPVKAGRQETGRTKDRREIDPVFFLEYWNNPEGTEEKFDGEWALSGDLGVKDKEGRFWFKGRKDDVIISAGYRIGPCEIEESLIRHPAVALAAVVGSPDKLRGSVVKAFVKLAGGYSASAALSKEIQQYVRKNLAAHEYPREIEFVDEVPMTTTGKIKRRDLRLREEHNKRTKGEGVDAITDPGDTK
jgi:acetyl-CoA synthetase